MIILTLCCCSWTERLVSNICNKRSIFGRFSKDFPIVKDHLSFCNLQSPYYAYVILSGVDMSFLTPTRKEAQHSQTIPGSAAPSCDTHPRSLQSLNAFVHALLLPPPLSHCNPHAMPWIWQWSLARFEHNINLKELMENHFLNLIQ